MWIYTSIAGALLGAACLAYIQKTKIGLWGYAQFDKTLDFLSPRIAKKIDELETRIKVIEARHIRNLDDGK